MCLEKTAFSLALRESLNEAAEAISDLAVFLEI
jgi:hypothetical protein